MLHYLPAIRASIPVLSMVLVAGCSGTPVDDQPNRGLEGFWRTEGYGHIVSIDEKQASLWEVTAVSCLLGFELGVGTAEDSDAEAVLILDSPSIRIDVLPGGTPDEKWLSVDGLASRRRLERVEALPEECGEDPGADPVFVFDVFWQTFAEHYPFFAMKGVDWAVVRERERPRVSSETTPGELFGILEGMIEPLEDAHTYLSAPDIERRFHGYRPGSAWLDDQERAEALELIDEKFLQDSAKSRCNEQLMLGDLPNGVRYLRLLSFSDYGHDFRDGMLCLDAALDELLAEPESVGGLVIDVRINEGGADPYGLAIASRLATERYLAYTKETRNDPDDPNSWSEGQPSLVGPAEGARFAGPVVLLTGHYSVSAAETFTMALMGRVPRVTRIGENTQGVFSDVLGRSLPNGWRFGLPNERFLTEDGRSFDGPGIEPDIEVPVFASEDVAARRDPALDRAMEVLSLP